MVLFCECFMADRGMSRGLDAQALFVLSCCELVGLMVMIVLTRSLSFAPPLFNVYFYIFVQGTRKPSH